MKMLSILAKKQLHINQLLLRYRKTILIFLSILFSMTLLSSITHVNDPKVYIAQNDIPIHTKITAMHLQEIRIPAELITPDIVIDPSAVLQKISNKTFHRGELITKNNFQDKLLLPSQRLLSVPISNESKYLRLKEGDKVDLFGKINSTNTTLLAEKAIVHSYFNGNSDASILSKQTTPTIIVIVNDWQSKMLASATDIMVVLHP